MKHNKSGQTDEKRKTAFGGNSPCSVALWVNSAALFVNMATFSLSNTSSLAYYKQKQITLTFMRS